MESSDLSKRDFLKVSAGTVGISIAGVLFERGGRGFSLFLRELELQGLENSMVSLANSDLELPNAWPGSRSELVHNPDLVSPPQILKDAIQKARIAGVDPYYKKPDGYISRLKELQLMGKSFANVLKAMAESGQVDMDSIRQDVVFELVTNVTENPVADISTSGYIETLFYPGLVQNSGIIARLVKTHRVISHEDYSDEIITDNGTMPLVQFLYKEDKVLSDGGRQIANDLMLQISDILNPLYKRHLKSGHKLSLSDLISETLVADEGDIVKAMVDAMLIMRILSRKNIQINTHGGIIKLEGDYEWGNKSPEEQRSTLMENAIFLSGLFKDELSLSAPVGVLVNILEQHPEYDLDKDRFKTNKQSKWQNLDPINRAGGWYHELNIMLQYLFVPPEAVSGTIDYYYHLSETMLRYASDPNKNGNYIDYLRRVGLLDQHGLIKTLSDLNILMYGVGIARVFDELPQKSSS